MNPLTDEVLNAYKAKKIMSGKKGKLAMKANEQFLKQLEKGTDRVSYSWLEGEQ